MQIIPSIDIFQGKCVRLSEGKFNTRKEYGIDAAEQARRFAESGAELLHVVDLEGAEAGRLMNWSAIEEMCAIERLHIQVGGGVRSASDVQRLLAMGVYRVVVGSLAVRSPDKVGQWAEKLGPENFCIAIDLKNGEIAYGGWKRTAPIRLETFIPGMASRGFTTYLSTDVRRDGMMKGPNVELYAELVRNFPSCRWIASGGVDTVESLRLLKQTGVEGAIIGKAFYEGTLTYEECVTNVC